MDKYNINDSQIELLAYKFWEERGCPQESPDEDWFRAKKLVSRQLQSLSNRLNRSQLSFASIRMGY